MAFIIAEFTQRNILWREKAWPFHIPAVRVAATLGVGHPRWPCFTNQRFSELK